jgi:hypothetical protein
MKAMQIILQKCVVGQEATLLGSDYLQSHSVSLSEFTRFTSVLCPNFCREENQW